MSGIRVTYSGLISLTIRLSSVITGIIFTLIVTRQLTEYEFGTWGLISGLLIYATVINPIITYWTTREIARGIDTSKTALMTSFGFSGIGTLIFIGISYLVSIESDAEFETMLFAAILIPVVFIYNTLSAINLGFKPQAVSYGLLVFEIIKIPMALIWIYYLEGGVEGAIVATFISYIASIGFLAYFAKEKIQKKLQKKIIKKWFKLFWIPSYRNIPFVLSLSDVVVFSVVTGSVVGVAYYTAARTIGYLVNHTRSFSSAVYPKLLEGGTREHLSENLIRLCYFAFPLMALSITFAGPGLFALNPIYQIAAPVVVILTIRSFLTTLNRIFFQSLQGIEKVDLDENATFKDYVKSKLMLYPTFQLIRNAIYFISLAVVFYFLSTERYEEIELVIFWAWIGLIIEIPLFFYILSLVRKSFELKIDGKSVFKYLIASIFSFGIIYVVMDSFLVYEESIFEFLPQVLTLGIFGVLIYFGITFVIDSRTKKLVLAVINEIKGNSKKGGKN